jgi:hypothetical protein
LNNEDPDLGNAIDQPGNVRIDTLSFGGERMAVDMDIRHPKWEVEVEVEVEAGGFQSGGPLASSSRRYQEADGWQVTKCEVSYVPLGGNEVAPEPIVLPRMSEVLSSYLARYIDLVNTYQLEQLSLNNNDNNDEDEEGEDDDSVLSIPFAEETESLALQAERVIIAFGENVVQIALLDKRMKKVEFQATSTSTEPATPRPLTEEELGTERNWFVEAEEVGRMVE